MPRIRHFSSRLSCVANRLPESIASEHRDAPARSYRKTDANGPACWPAQTRTVTAADVANPPHHPAPAPHPDISCHRRMAGGDIHETHRVSTLPELRCDLAFLVVIATALSRLHHAVAEHHLSQDLVGYASAFFAICWAWMNFTWFANDHHTDETTYPMLTQTSMAGVRVLASGVPSASHGDFITVTREDRMMLAGVVAPWRLAAREHQERKQTCMHYAHGTQFAQALRGAAAGASDGRARRAAAYRAILHALSVGAWRHMATTSGPVTATPRS